MFNHPALAGFVIYNLFNRDHDFPEEFAQTFLSDPAFQGITNCSFAIALHLQHIPLHLLLSTFRHGR